MENKKIKKITRNMSIFVAALLSIYILYKNYPPFGADIVLTGKNISDLTPGDRVVSFPKPVAQISDLVYFNTRSEGYDSATVNITFKPDNPNQEINIGFKDQKSYHYKTQPLYAPLIENLAWFSLSKSPPYLYQKNPKFLSAEQFFRYPPKSERVGTYHLSENDTINVLNDYVPKNTPTTINIPLRGAHTFYTYINNEPFNLRIGKQDLNWYDGIDELFVKVYKDGLLLTEKKIADDGVVDNSRKVMLTQFTEIIYTEGNPDPGVYKIVISGNGDLVVNLIKSSFSKIVFDGPIYPIARSKVYDSGISGEGLSIIYTDSSNLNFVAYHQPSLGEIDINGIKMDLVETAVPAEINPGVDRSIVTIPKGDVVVNGNGYFAFSKDQFFTPFIYRKHEIKNTDKLENIDYILTDYRKTQISADGWKTQNINFDLTDAYYSKRALNWVISAPGLKKSGNKIQIKEIKIILHKKGIINF